MKTRAYSDHIVTLDGAKSIRWLGEQGRAMWVASGKLFNDAKGLIWPTEGCFFSAHRRSVAGHLFSAGPWAAA